MKLTSLIGSLLMPELRTNLILSIVVFSSLLSLIASVVLTPNEKIKAVWNDQHQFINCVKDDNQKGGVVRWYRGSSQHPVDDNAQAPVYMKEDGRGAKLFLIRLSKKFSGIYECRHELEGKVVSSDKVEIKVYNDIDMSGKKQWFRSLLPQLFHCSERIGNKRSYVGTEGLGLFSMHCIARFDSDSDSADSQQIYWFHNGRQIADNKEDPQFRANNELKQSVDYKSITSTLKIPNLNKDHEGVYVCQATYANPYLSSMKDIQINLRVNYKPRFLEKTNKKVWISENSSGPLTVNVTCVVNADPVANFQWRTHDDRPITTHQTSARIPNMPQYNIIESENMSILSLTYQDLSEIQKNFDDPEARRRQFKCIANNSIGEAKQDFAISIGKLPDPQTLDKYYYNDGVLVLTINKTEVSPPIDMYRVEIDQHIHLYFNESNKSQTGDDTYEIRVEMPSGSHKLKVFAHNPVGWSEENNLIPSPLLIVISGSTVAQQYSVLAMLASILALRYAL